jgi:hypothetical protein
MALALICAVVILLSIAGIAATFLTRLELNVDGILLLLSSLVMGGVFSLMLFLLAREEGWLPARKKQEAPADTAHAKQAASPTKGAAPVSAKKETPQVAK